MKNYYAIIRTSDARLLDDWGPTFGWVVSKAKPLAIDRAATLLCALRLLSPDEEYIIIEYHELK